MSHRPIPVLLPRGASVAVSRATPIQPMPMVTSAKIRKLVRARPVAGWPLSMVVRRVGAVVAFISVLPSARRWLAGVGRRAL